MNKKNPVVGAILGLFIIGLFYATGFTKKGVIAVVALIAIQWGIAVAVDASISGIVSLVSAFLGYKWSKESGLEEAAAE